DRRNARFFPRSLQHVCAPVEHKVSLLLVTVGDDVKNVILDDGAIAGYRSNTPPAPKVVRLGWDLVSPWPIANLLVFASRRRRLPNLTSGKSPVPDGCPAACQKIGKALSP